MVSKIRLEAPEKKKNAGRTRKARENGRDSLAGQEFSMAGWAIEIRDQRTQRIRRASDLYLIIGKL
jgi:hypothetical protein